MTDRHRRFPPPWTVDEREGGELFIVRDANGQALAYLYFEDEPQRQMSMKRLSRDEARRIAANIAKLPRVAAMDQLGSGARSPRAHCYFCPR